ncbi:3'-5' exonuclease [Actinomadura atramentaria]|uniref:3'-5' exonuclease n=1 Tax=Actinomadura atramentaria TaxID=1990 RepID=UPI00036CF7C4|nr:3'-5' exonuclease [Actinomadura atramentaria]
MTGTTGTSSAEVPPPRKPRRTKAHSPRELAAALGWTDGQMARALAAGTVLPPFDMRTPRWSGTTVDGLVASAAELTAAVPELADRDQLREALGITRGEFRRGTDAGAIPAPDTGEFWSAALLRDLVARAEEVRAAIPPQPLGARRCAELAAERTGLDVTEDDVQVLIDRELVAEVDEYKGWPLYDVAALTALTESDDGRLVLAEVVAARHAWLAASITTEDAAVWLDWRAADLERVAAEQGITPGRDGRWAREDIAHLTDDQDLVDDVRRARLVGPETAATRMEIRRRDFDYVRAAGWVRVATWMEMKVGVRKTVQVPLFRVGDIEDALQTPGVDWEAVRATRPGEPSPLREWTRLPIKRADVVHGFCGALAEQWSIEVWPHYWNAEDRWEIDWEVRQDGHPTLGEVRQALADHPGADAHLGGIHLSTAVGDVIRWARDMLEPGAAVVLDTETTDLGGVVIELAVIDAATGDVLLDTLVCPDGVPVEPGARRVHGITDAELADAPPWADVLPRFLDAVAGRTVLAYNAPFDRDRLHQTHQHAGLDPADLPTDWGCLMQARSTWARTGRWLPLGGNHRALGDARDARTILQTLVAPHR